MQLTQSRLLIFVCLAYTTIAHAQFVPQTPYRPSDEAPTWVRMMYGGLAKPERVRAAYEAYYATHSFEKNRDTQFYKRWMRNIELPTASISRAYSAAHTVNANRMTGEWNEMGPWSYDPEVALGRLTQLRTELDLGLPAGVYHLRVEGMSGVKWAIR